MVRSGAEAGELAGLGLLDLADQPGPLPDLVGVGHDLGAGPAVVVVGEAGVGPGPGLDQHRDAVLAHLAHAVGRDGHPVLVGLDLAGHADDERRAVRAARGVLSRASIDSIRAWRITRAIDVELLGPGDQRGRELQDRVAAVVGPAVQPEREHPGRQQRRAAAARPRRPAKVSLVSLSLTSSMP